MEARVYIAGLAVVALMGAAYLFWKPLWIRYNIVQLQRLRASDDTWARNFESEAHFQQLFRHGAVQAGMTVEEVAAILGRPDEDKRLPEHCWRRCFWTTFADDGCVEGYVVTFGPDGRADFVPRPARPGERIDGHGPPWLVRRPDMIQAKATLNR